MADQSVHNLSDKPSVSLVQSANHKADIISDRLHELKIAYTVMSKYPNVLREFVSAVKAGVNPPE